MASLNSDSNRATKALILLFALLVKKGQVDEALGLGKIITSVRNENLFGELNYDMLEPSADMALLESKFMLLMLKDLFVQEKKNFQTRSPVGAAVTVAKAIGYLPVARRSLGHVTKFLRINMETDKSWINVERLIWVLVQENQLLLDLGLFSDGLVAISKAWELFKKYHNEKTKKYWPPMIVEQLAHSQLKNGNYIEAAQARKLLYNIELENQFDNFDRFQANAGLVDFLFKCRQYQDVIPYVKQLFALSKSSSVRNHPASNLFLLSCLTIGLKSANEIGDYISLQNFLKKAIVLGREAHHEFRDPQTAFDLADALILGIEFRLTQNENVNATEISEVRNLISESQAYKGDEAGKLMEKLDSLKNKI